MKHSRTLVFLVAMSLSATAWSRDAKDPRGKFTVFNAPGAGTAGSEGTSVAGFNQEGVLVGYVSDAGGNLTGFLRNRDGGFTPISDPLTVPGGIGAIPTAVNSNDDVVGIYEPAVQYLFTSFIRTRSGEYSDIHAPNTLATGIIDTLAYSINSRGEIAGEYYLSDGTNQSFVRSPRGEFDEFTAPGAVSTNAVSINDGGAVTGTYSDANGAIHGFVRSPGGFITEFDAPTAGTGTDEGTNPLSISSSGTIVGSFIDGTLSTHGFVRDAKGSFKVVDIPGAISTIVSGVSGSEIVGTFVDLGLVSHGFILSGDGSVLTLDAPGAGKTSQLGTTVVGVTDEGVVIGYDSDSNGAFHGFLWRTDED